MRSPAPGLVRTASMPAGRGRASRPAPAERRGSPRGSRGRGGLAKGERTARDFGTAPPRRCARRRRVHRVRAGRGAETLPAPTPRRAPLVVPSGPVGRPVHLEPHRHQRDGDGDDQCRSPRRQPQARALRLLLRVPDRLDRDERERRPDRAAGREGGGLRPGLPVLPALQCVGADVPPGHGGRVGGRTALRAGVATATPACWRPGRTISPTTTTAGRSSSSGTRRAPPCSSGFCRPRSTRHRASASGWCPPSSSGQRAGPDRPDGRRQLQQHPDLRFGDPDRLCHRLLDLRVTAAGQLVLRPAGTGVSLLSGQTASGSQQVACVNPVTFSSQAGSLQPYFRIATDSRPGCGSRRPG